MPHRRRLAPAICRACGQPFIAVQWGGGLSRQTCSLKCFKKIRRVPKLRGAASPTWKGGQPTWICRRCQVPFKAYQRKKEQGRQFCSWRCANIAHGIPGGAEEMRRRVMYEHELIARLTERGYGCLRSAGSRGPIDLFAFNESHCRMIQVKSTIAFERQGNRSIFRRAIEDAMAVPQPPNAVRELWVRVLRHGWSYLVMDDLPANWRELPHRSWPWQEA